MNVLVSPLAAYRSARDLHITRANHLAIVERDIATFWNEAQLDPSLPVREADARTTRITRLMAERGAVLVVERQAFDGLAAAVSTLVTALPAGALRTAATARLDAWPAQRDGMRDADTGEGAIDTAHRALIEELCALLDPLVEQGSMFSA